MIKELFFALSFPEELVQNFLSEFLLLIFFFLLPWLDSSGSPLF